MGKGEAGSTVLKADLHLHTCEGDPFIAYDARGLIDRAARDGFQALSITNHDTVTFDYAVPSIMSHRLPSDCT